MSLLTVEANQLEHVQGMVDAITQWKRHQFHLQNLSSLLSFLQSNIPSTLPPLKISNSALVTPPLSPPTFRNPNPILNWETIAKEL
ncbi:hypothetical protein J1N35_004195 [Gossypium stocksii]|uniref:Uncharacterized protein n=1 Tax=Gossypium stocksii TaxID=47602 RepID=A0A9D3WDL9_9ROSI|nr:hypothetical protein J1N35_004195 [Gossypium stocksii]